MGVERPHNQSQRTSIQTELEIGQLVRGKYEILSKLGSGGMASVYKVRHKLFREEYALKIVHPHFMHDDSFLKRFKNEAAIVRRLQHVNAVRVHDFDHDENDRPYIVMELVDGLTLYDARRNHPSPWTLPLTIEVAIQVAAALEAAHALGIVHRDIKPANVILLRYSKDDVRVKVADFGIAKVSRTAAFEISAVITEQNLVIGTPEYMSPEQASGQADKAIDGRSDIYSLGLMLYEMATGVHPYKADTPLAMVLQHMNVIPVAPSSLRPGLSAPLSKLILKCLEKNPNQRFQTAGELITNLKRLRIHESPEARSQNVDLNGNTLPPTSQSEPPKPIQRSPRSSRFYVYLAICAVLITVAGIAASSHIRKIHKYGPDDVSVINQAFKFVLVTPAAAQPTSPEAATFVLELHPLQKPHTVPLPIANAAKVTQHPMLANPVPAHGADTLPTLAQAFFAPTDARLQGPNGNLRKSPSSEQIFRLSATDSMFKTYQQSTTNEQRAMRTQAVMHYMELQHVCSPHGIQSASSSPEAIFLATATPEMLQIYSQSSRESQSAMRGQAVIDYLTQCNQLTDGSHSNKKPKQK